MPNDRDRRRPIGPPPGVPLLPVQPDPNEDTGPYVRAAFHTIAERLDASEKRHEESNKKLDEAIKIDKEDHANMVGTMAGQNEVMKSQSQRLEKIEGLVNETADRSKTHGDRLADLTAQSAAHGGELKGVAITLSVMAKAIGVDGDVKAAKKKADIDEAVDVRKRRRDIAYGVVKVVAVAVATWLVAHFSGLH